MSAMYAMAKRAKELADTSMATLRKVYVRDESYEGLTSDGRGVIIENVLTQEFEDQAESADALLED